MAVSPSESPLPAAQGHPGSPACGAGGAEGAENGGRHGPGLAEDYDYDRYSRLAGELTEPPDGPYRVRYRRLIGGGAGRRLGAGLLSVAAPLVSLVLVVWLMRPEHWVDRPYATAWEHAADTVVTLSIGLVESFRLVNVISNAHATWMARDPVPVRPQPGTRVAFLTTYVPGKEPFSMVRATLEGAVRIVHDGTLDVWLLDEGDDAEVKGLCKRLGVKHFTRKGVERWNRPAGCFRARTKHGNYNAWLDAHGAGYEFMACVDTDHVPLPNFLERMLGYFRDPDVAFVVGPQVYGNYTAAVTKAAESQQFLFHALIQRAGNAYGSPMFVGTSNCVRTTVLRQIGGLYDSITEDMATGLEIHRRRNPATGRRWRSVYTPDVLAVGEGPSSWTDFFSQQLRWSRGTYEALLRQYWRAMWQLTPGRVLNYSLMVAYYPMAALNWVLGGLSCVLFLGLGASGINVESRVWLMLYADAAALQIGLYLWNRRHNVSPHEPAGSSGAAGMLMSALAAPLYARSLLEALLRRRSRFVVTPKGDSASPDRMATFRTHLVWAGAFIVSLAASALFGHAHTAMRVWALLALGTALLPLVVWRAGLRRETGAVLPMAVAAGEDPARTVSQRSPV
ncbi:glycosyltransferase family 2 protein [Streptomyces sp. NPDC052396]|uniref:glycosyltransferase family 2 protein n=1 Tax=Streptomyces sp. NPDC052396 TaxID=3365689 RepID=UPI0037D4F842